MGLDALYQYLREEQAQYFALIDLIEKSRIDFDKLRSKKNGMQKVRVCMDAESCLHRLYGGYYTDWVCGGQWGRMASYVNGLMQTLGMNNIELVVVFNGSLESQRLDEWRQKQWSNRDKACHVLRHISFKTTPPPKVWWIPPNCLRSSIKMVFRQPHVIVMTTKKDHHKELVQFYKERNCWGLIADDLEFAALGIKKYFSGDNLKMYKGNVETTELKVEELLHSLNICPARFRILRILLGNHILTERELIGFHASLHRGQKVNQKDFIKSLIEFVGKLPPDTEPEILGSQIFGVSSYDRITKFVKSVKYYTNIEDEEDTAISDTSSISGGGKGKSYDWSEIVERECDGEGSIYSIDSMPKIDDDIVKIATERHHLGLMVPWVYQILTAGEIKIPFGIEEDTPMEFPSTTLFYRPLRQMTYSILFGQGHDSSLPKVYVKEWAWTKTNQYNHPDFVPCLSLSEPMPSLQELWFGRSPEHNSCRIRAFLTCMRSDTALMLNTSYVPQHYVILCSVLRYMMTDPNGPLLRKQELDCFLAQAVCSNLRKTAQSDNIELPSVNVRGVLLASLFMQGVENALFANDVCGSPVPVAMCCPWLYFDGKLFHRKLLKLNETRNLIEMCDGHIDEVATVEKLRLAVLDGLKVQFAHTPLIPHTSFWNSSTQKHKQNTGNPSGMVKPEPKVPSLISAASTFARGGQLEIAGVVVGSWSPNYGQLSHCRSRSSDKQMSTEQLRKVGRTRNISTSMQQPPKKTIQRPIQGIQQREGCNYRPQSGNKKHPRNKKTNNPEISSSHSSLVAPFSNMKLGIGRGCTIETNSKVIQVSKMIQESQESSSDFLMARDTAEKLDEESGKKSKENITPHSIKETSSLQNYHCFSGDLDFLPQFRIDEYKPCNINS